MVSHIKRSPENQLFKSPADLLDKATLYVHDVAHVALQLPHYDALHVHDAHEQGGHDVQLFHADRLYGALQLAYDDEPLSHGVPLLSRGVRLLLLTFDSLLLSRFMGAEVLRTETSGNP